ncbi:unnamed protein product [Nippostrongylus brasiliensis]|uniref:DUF1758 domain-containing protein n=1 Tax=Nippostrongylus brasiliensis TaxID=27835 RepID=A0A0N4YKG6_NIPBR|nr:unnamed protein product [Nippostrongylus brasiliensis]
MTTTLSLRQGLLTKACTRLSTLLNSHEDLLAQPVENMNKDGDYTKAWQKYTREADNLDSDIPSSSDITEKYDEETRPEETSRFDAPQVSLPPIPIPEFDGKVWEGKTLWGAFNHSVHSRNMDDLHKMNYFLDALQGEAKNSIKQYEISRTTYPAVISYLQEKYGDKEALIDQLLWKLQAARAPSNRLEDQENLCESLMALVNQLELKGEHIDNIFLQKQLLGKFSMEVQRQILRQEQQRPWDTKWGTKDVLSAARAYIRAERKIVQQVEKREQEQTRRTESQKRTVLPKKNTVLHVANGRHQSYSLILVGQPLVFNPQAQDLETVYVMLDSGADRSFISTDLARRLRLPEIQSTVLRINTFGSRTPMEKKCGVTEIKLWDRDGIPHSYSVTAIDVLTESIYRSTRTAEDKKFLYENDIALSISPNTQQIRADLLLGCSDLFTLLEKNVGLQRTLPSGLKVLPSNTRSKLHPISSRV